MKRVVFALTAIVVAILVGCGTPVPTPAPTDMPRDQLLLPGGYRPVQQNDFVEGAKIGYQYVVPSTDNPVAVIAFSEGLIQLMSIKTELRDGLVAYLQDIAKEAKPILAFDENDPTQKEPKTMTWDSKKPIEIVFVSIANNSQVIWSMRETENAEIRAAYKLIRRKDGGLRFVDGYDLTTVNSFNTMRTLNGGGTGLGLSARLALLRLILSDATYQRGENIMAIQPPRIEQYDSRILKIDPTQQGLAQDRDWVLVSRPGPSGGIPVAP